MLTLLTLAAVGSTLAWARLDRTAADRDRRFRVTGSVVAPRQGARLTVAHDEIPGYMPAMTMAFVVPEGESTSVRTGDRVAFTLRVGPDGTRGEALRVIGHAEPDPSSRTGRTPIARLKPGDFLPEIDLVDQDGKPITRDDFRGHATVVTFVFTRCPLPEFCPLVTSRFKELQAALANEDFVHRETRLLSISIDPEFDTPTVLRAYAQSVRADPARWRFAGGNPDDVTRVARAFAVYVERNGMLLDHTLATALIDPQARVVAIWRGNLWKSREVIEAIKAQRR